jgi:hypothetical protein
VPEGAEMGKKARGDISKKIRDLCFALLNNKITDTQFKTGIKEIISEYREMAVIFQDIGLSIQKESLKYGDILNQRVWKLADQSDVKIRDSYNNWWRKMQR